MAYTTIKTRTEDRVLLITLARPEAMNALNTRLMEELSDVIEKADVDPGIAVMILTGSEKAFAAGADIKEMQGKTAMEAFSENFISANWEAAARCRKPIIAAVAGYALGGGCELAMMCDFIIAADTAKFGQPEITIGAIPGAGGTQRLTRAVGKSKAMEMILTGRMMKAEEAERAGLVARVVAASDLLDEAFKTARKIASYSRPVTMMAKECVNRAFESSLAEGVLFERRVFHGVFASEDQKEGMAAFVEKRDPTFKHR
ncbi:enoyl-CoA hydratase [Parvularcula dongshanensis]|uniref:enoyl-CoA hydratase n=1 Tax=Parvularcula dongshanensis TaxID=1173995 RepID=A0A840I6E3_9PROT|nr:enoyl-CoA hydratase [Parvularcula dongshanensis]MBB4659823.1 enoyl-CoA hydratase [Parvularcula dongshanensis]